MYRFWKPGLTATLALLAASLLACASGDHKPVRGSRGDVLTIATSADADALLPPLVQTTQGNQAADLLFDYLAQPIDAVETLGDKGFKARLASGWQWSHDSLSIAFTVNANARWHDGHPVRARDVAFSFLLYTDSLVASPQADNFAGIDSVTVRDSLTAVVWWKKHVPEQFAQVATNLAIMPEHLLAHEPRATLAQSAFAQHPVGSGRYRFEQWTRQRQLILRADTANYRGRPNFNRVVWIVSPDPTAASLNVLSGAADVLESVRGDAFLKTRQSSTVRAIEYGSLDYAFMQFNLQRSGESHPLFANHALRVAITEALDRRAMVANALDSLGAVALGPFTRSSPIADTTLHQIAFDSARASHTLDSLGWKLDHADSTRKLNGKPLQFELLVPSSSATRQKYAVLIQGQLAEIGVKVAVTPLEIGLFASRLQKGDFDAALNMWRTGTSPSEILHVWGPARGKDVGANYGRYANRTLNAVLDSASTTFDVATRRTQFNRAYQTIVDDAPAVWLYEPRNFAAVAKRIEPVGMRAYSWLASLPEWRLSGANVASTR